MIDAAAAADDHFAGAVNIPSEAEARVKVIFIAFRGAQIAAQ